MELVQYVESVGVLDAKITYCFRFIDTEGYIHKFDEEFIFVGRTFKKDFKRILENV